ncbi:MAG: arginine decarboxylase [Bacteroidota bacterium]|nr:arginine decarboxylase [Bacteroidota bacterium]
MDRYVDLIHQNFEFPTVEFKELKDELYFHDIPLMKLIKKYGTPLRLTYLPKITQQIQKARRLFRNAMKKYDYEGEYTYCYCTKSSHFSFILEQALESDIYLETSSANDLEIIKSLLAKKKIDKDLYILCNGYKQKKYTDGIIELYQKGFTNVVPILDNLKEIDSYEGKLEGKLQVGIRLAADEEPKFEFYTSRLGIRPSEVVNFYKERIKNSKNFNLKLLHFFINTGIKDSPYYWNEFTEFLHLYCELKQICPTLDTIDIGGGFPIKTNINFEYDYKYMTEQIIENIVNICKEYNVPNPNIFTEFGSFTVGEAGAIIYSVIDCKQQNDKELWYMIDSSFMTTIPDVWGLKQKFIMLAINQWEKEYTRVNLGGITCDSMDYYNSEADGQDVFLPVFDPNEQLYVGFFHTGAYQESVGGYGGVQHCLVPAPKHVIVDLDDDDNIQTRLFAPEQSTDSMLKVLGYK